MNTKTILGISLAATFAVAMVFSQSVLATEAGFHNVEDTTVTKNQPGNTVNVTWDTEGTIPVDGMSGAFGYGLVTTLNDDDLPENVLAVTSHKCVSDSFEQGDADISECSEPVAGLLEALGFPAGSNEAHDDEAFHAHVLDLKAIVDTSSCSTVGNNIGLEVDLVRSLQTGNNISPDYPVSVDDDKITVSDVPRKDIKSSNFKNPVLSAFFGIAGIVDDSDPANPVVTNLCLTDGS
jgi:hypothetical protein